MKLNQAATHPLVITMKDLERDARTTDRYISRETDEEKLITLRHESKRLWADVHRIVRQLKNDPDVCLRVVRHVR